MADELTAFDIQQLRLLRERGFAVIVWTPEELRNAVPHKVEDRLIELGWDVIDMLQPEEE